MDYVFLAIGAGGVVLQVVVIYLMTKGFYREYPVVFFFLLVLFLTTISDFAAYLDIAAYRSWYARVFYVNNTVRYFSGFAAVASVYLKVTAVDAAMAQTRWKVIVGTSVVLLSVFGWHLWGFESLRSYLSVVGRDMSFITAILTMILWMALIRYRVRDRFLFLLTSGLGLNLTGDAIGLSLLKLGAPGGIPSAVAIGGHILCLLIWIKALRERERLNAPPVAVG